MERKGESIGRPRREERQRTLLQTLHRSPHPHSFSNQRAEPPPPPPPPPPGGQNEQLTEPLKKALLLAGFIEAAATKEAGDGPATETMAKKPDWAPSAAVALPAAVAARKAPEDAAVSAWDAAAATSAGDEGEEEEETIDEDALLAADGDLKPSKITLDPEGKAGAACPPTKSACKDCSCGRAEREAANGGEAEAAPKLTREMIENPQSNCGSCGLGDAFRCGGCPYRGLPAFQTGKKIELPADFLIADT